MTDDGDSRGLFGAFVGDGRALIALTGIILILAGGFAIFQSATGQFLPQDVEYLGMNARDLCRIDQCRIVHFMFHDRVSFGGSIIAIGTLYWWLSEFPLKRGEAWAWWVLMIGGAEGFASFLAYLGYGYLDQWHGAATLGLLPIFIGGIWISRKVVRGERRASALLTPGVRVKWKSRGMGGAGFASAIAVALIAAGMTIMVVGMTSVFVPQDLEFMGMSPAELRAINPHLVPLIAHDRAGFGGGLCCTGITVLACVWCGRPSRSWWQALCVAGLAGFATAIGIHPVIGYTSASHLAPAVIVGSLFFVGLGLVRNSKIRNSKSESMTKFE